MICWGLYHAIKLYAGSHESLRQCYHKLSQKYRRCIAIDETKIKIGEYIWTALQRMGLRYENETFGEGKRRKMANCFPL
ncbi:MAG: hypothetical protein QW519_05235 [Candidatus Thermoplasmatota archaeon]